MDNEPTNCQVCSAALTSGYVYMYQGNQIVGAYCFSCDKRRTLDRYKETRVLSTRLLTSNILDLLEIGRSWSYHKPDDRTYKLKTFHDIVREGTPEELEEVRLQLEIRCSFQKIHAKIKEFEQRVWFKGLQETIRRSKCKGVSATDTPFAGFHVLTYTMCGRTIITVEDKQSSVSMICLDDSSESTMGGKGIDATEEQAIHLINLAIELYESGHLKFKDDKEVSYL